METGITLLGVLGVLFLLVYWLPATIAVRRLHPNAVAIYLINLLLGGTGVGWFGALIWSVLSVKDDERRQPGRGLKVVLVLSWIGTLVVILLALFAPIVTTQLLTAAEEAKVNATRVQIQALAAAVDLYRLQNGSYPTTNQGLAALLHKPSVGIIPNTWRGPYLNSGNLPLDGWKRPFLYTSDGQTFVITSLGADGVEGGTGLNADMRSTDP